MDSVNPQLDLQSKGQPGLKVTIFDHATPSSSPIPSPPLHGQSQSPPLPLPSSSSAPSSSGLHSHYMQYVRDEPDVVHSPTYLDHALEIIAFIRQEAQVIDTRAGHLVVLFSVLIYLSLIFIGLVLLAYDPYHIGHKILFRMLPIISIISIILSHIYLLEQIVRFIAFGSSYFLRNVWNMFDALIVTVLVVSQWVFWIPESIIAGVVVGFRMWRMLKLVEDDVEYSRNQVHFEDDMERLMYLGTNLKREMDREGILRSKLHKQRKTRMEIKGKLENSMSLAFKHQK